MVLYLINNGAVIVSFISESLRLRIDGNKGQAMALGPEVKYDYKNMAFHLKYQQEFEVENKAETDRFWFKFMYAF